MTFWKQLIFLFFIFEISFAQHKQLLEHLFKTYRKELRPVRHESSGPTNVTVQLYFKQIQKISESDQILTLYCWLEEYWKDEYLTWDPQEFGGVKELHVPAEIIWRPDLLVYNNANMNVKENELQTNALINFDGSVSLFRAIITDISCSLSLHRFPFDQQVCYIMLASWSYSGSEILLSIAEPAASEGNATTSTASSEKNNNKIKNPALRHYIPNMEWKLTDFKQRINTKYYSCCDSPYPDISYFFAIKRNPSYYLFTLIVPSAFITIVTVVGFFTPHSSTGENTEKVSLGVTALLSLAIILMMVSDSLPATSDTVPLLGQYYIGLIMIMFTATYCTTWTLGVQMQGNAGKAIPRRIRNLILHMNRDSWFISLLFGRELKNSQTSIKMRMKKHDHLSALKKHFASEFVQIQRLFCAEVPTAQNDALKPCVKHLNNTNNSNGSIPLIDAEERPSDSGHVCDSKIFDGSNKVINDLLSEVLTSVKAIRQDLLADEHLKTIRNEWQMLARMIEKILMIFFTTFTVLFALFMLYDNQSEPIITDKIMDQQTIT
uniref:Uncharacterized protein n=1 Tax=Panagrolaimus sp. PS1159 TaxID=55785 RepID=A0AC35GMB4_9BILA